MDYQKKYVIEPDRISYSIDTGRSKVCPDSFDETVWKERILCSEYNRGVKRDDTILVTGDLPKFAMMRNYDEDKVAPDLIGLGNGRVWLSITNINGHIKSWLDDIDEIHTIFRPWGAEYICALLGSTIHLYVIQAIGGGIAARLEVCSDIQPTELTVKYEFGDLRIINRTFSPAYFCDEQKSNLKTMIEAIQDIIILSANERIKDAVGIYAKDMIPDLCGDRVEFIKKDHPKINKTSIFDLFIVYTDINNKNNLNSRLHTLTFEECLEENIGYYNNLLAPYDMKTPDNILDSAFLASIINLDYAHDGYAWVEGVQWWSAVFCNNYQISAAIALGHLADAERALRFVGTRKDGPFCNTLASFKPEKDEKRNIDALPYHLHQFFQYFRMTGDIKLARDLWPEYEKAIRKMFIVRDGDQDLLLDWQKGCNLFLYQADHLCMPGAGASPSLMMFGMIEQMSQLGYELGYNESAEEYKKLAIAMKYQIINNLWDEESATFFNHIDHEKLKHPAHFYTDLVFPLLYTSLNEKYTWGCLEHLRDTLIFRSEISNLLLMRCGDLKPKWFGNDEVMPTQSAESARALFKYGIPNEGYELLHAIATAATIFTDAPGEFPEHCNDEGKGLPNYIFGNPIGSFAYSVVDGLFGISVVDCGNTFYWKPSFPDSWDNASMSLPYASIEFASEFKDNVYIAKYKVNTSYKKVKMEIQLPIISIYDVTCNGDEISYKQIPKINGTKIYIEIDNINNLTITITYTKLDINIKKLKYAVIGEEQEWILPFKIKEIIDPRKVLENVKVNDCSVKTNIRKCENYNTVYLNLNKIKSIIILKFKSVMPYNVNISEVNILPDKAVINLIIKNYKHDLIVDMCLNVKIFGIKKSIKFSCSTEEKILSISLPVSNLAEGKYLCNTQLFVDGHEEFNKTITIEPKASGKVLEDMIKERDKRTVCLDISKQRNSDFIYLVNGWRVGDNSIIGFGDNTIYKDGAVSTLYGKFNTGILPIKFARAEVGRIDWDEKNEIIYSEYTNKINISIGYKVDMVSLFYISEPEARHTDTCLGRISFNYEDGNEIYNLVGGDHLQAINDINQTSVERLKVFLMNNANPQLDRGSVLRIACDNKKLLKNITIIIDYMDVQIGIIGASVLKTINS